eukprot:5727328-Prymnesium_polylepis.1
MCIRDRSRGVRVAWRLASAVLRCCHYSSAHFVSDRGRGAGPVRPSHAVADRFSAFRVEFATI